MNILIGAAMAVCVAAQPNLYEHLNVTTSPTGGDDVIHAGVANTNYEEFGRYIEKENFTDWYLYLNLPSTVSTKLLLKVKSITWPSQLIKPSTMEVDQLTLDGKALKLGDTITVSPKDTKLRFHYSCHNTLLIQKHNITFTLGQASPVTNTYGANYGDIPIKFTKDCFPLFPPGPNPIPGSNSKNDGKSGMNGAETFFLVVFILTLVGCLVGCGFNYKVKSRQGFDIVPGSGYFRLCWEKVRGGNTNAYQTQLNANAHTEYEGAYQSDL